MRQKHQICVIGLGYIGLPTAVLCANSGLDVLGVDIDRQKRELIESGVAPFEEEGFDSLLVKSIESRKLVTSDCPEESEVYLIAVPTPLTQEKTPDLTAVFEVVEDIAKILQEGELIIIESTSPPSTTQNVIDLIRSRRPDLEVAKNNEESVQVVYCPERVLPGDMIREFRQNDRIVGADNAYGAKKATDIYSRISDGAVTVTTPACAEFVKLAENSFRDVNIAFANELSLLAESCNVDVYEAIELANRHPRVSILSPGPGVGGHCIAVDPWFLTGMTPHSGTLIKTSRQLNDKMPRYTAEKILSSHRVDQLEPIRVFGLTFKPNVDDLRGSPAMEVVRTLVDLAPSVLVEVVDPHVAELPAILSENSNLRQVDLSQGFSKEGINVLLVAHQEFKDLLAQQNKHHKILDFVGLNR